MTTQDHLLEARLEKNREAAHAACAARIAELGLSATLVDVEHLFDGHTLMFYFLGESSSELEAVLEELAAVYEAHTQFRRFAETLAFGCGPGCGTEDATGGGCSSCATGCGAAALCGTRRG